MRGWQIFMASQGPFYAEYVAFVINRQYGMVE